LVAVTAVAAHYVVGPGWAESLLIGAILSSTAPVFASALVGNEKPRTSRSTAWRSACWCWLLVLESGIAAADDIFHLVALTIVLPILLHSSTDVVVARAFDEQAEMPAWYGLVRRWGSAARRTGAGKA
jgi:NhaP-type Na+/H+ or K+/H+ antiporter